MMMMFHRKVLRADDSVVCTIEMFQEGGREDVGIVRFPNKQTWTKFWGAVQRGSMVIPDLEVHMENVPDDSPAQQPAAGELPEGAPAGGGGEASETK